MAVAPSQAVFYAIRMRDAVSDFVETIAPVGAVPDDLNSIFASVVADYDHGTFISQYRDTHDDIEYLEDETMLAAAYEQLRGEYHERIKALGLDSTGMLLHRVTHHGDFILYTLPY